MNAIRDKQIKAIRLSDDEEILEIKLEDGAILEIKTDCDYDNYHKLSVTMKGAKPEGWIT